MHVEKATGIPTTDAARIERQGAVGQRNSRVDVLPAPTENKRGVGENTSVVIGDRQCLFGQSDGFVTICHGIFRPAVDRKSIVAYPGPGKCQAIARVARDRLSEQIACLEQLLLPQPRKIRQGAQVEIVGRQVVCWPVGRTRDFGGLQGRLYDPGDADCDSVLKLKDVLQRAVEAVGPEVRAVGGVDQLSSYSYLRSGRP